VVDPVMPVDFTTAGYAKLIETITDAGWEFANFQDALQSRSQLIVMRHDIDAELYLLKSFLDAERKYSVNSTYFVMLESPFYNVYSPEGRRALSSIVADGHSLGLHFFGEIHKTLNTVELVQQIKSQLARLSDLAATPVSAFSFHQPTAEMIASAIEIPGVVNTYHPIVMRRLRYLTDTNMQWKPSSPEDVLGDVSLPIQMLLHPLWWIADGQDAVQRWKHILQLTTETHAQHLLQRERTLHGLTLSDLV
jgi:hypothetical protein